MRAQVCEEPRDHFHDCAPTIADWLSAAEDEGAALDHLCRAVEAVAETDVWRNDCDGLRTIRVGYDPGSDQSFFLFKMSNNGTTIVVSPSGLAVEEFSAYP